MGQEKKTFFTLSFIGFSLILIFSVTSFFPFILCDRGGAAFSERVLIGRFLNRFILAWESLVISPIRYSWFIFSQANSSTSSSCPSCVVLSLDSLGNCPSLMALAFALNLWFWHIKVAHCLCQNSWRLLKTSNFAVKISINYSRVSCKMKYGDIFHMLNQQ